MSIEDDKPVKLKNLSKAGARERKECRIIGRLLDPDNQKMSSLIHDMPHLWSTYQRCRGYVLSNERFQFVFYSETELKAVWMRVCGPMPIGLWFLRDGWNKNMLITCSFCRFG